MPERVVEVTREVRSLADQAVRDIRTLMSRTQVLALNAKIEAVRAGDAGAGFGTVADEVSEVSARIDALATELGARLADRTEELSKLGTDLVGRVRGTRLADLALNAIETVDRNLFERTADVRWWATDSAFVAACADPGAGTAGHASRRLGVILSSYTVYLDLWVCDTRGRVIASGRPDRFPGVLGADVSGQAWFRDALATRTGEDFAVADIRQEALLDRARTATYATAVRTDGEVHGAPIGVLGVHFDWDPLGNGVLTGLRLAEEERARTRAVIVDANHRIIAAADGQGILIDSLSLPANLPAVSHELRADGSVLAQALTPGYETYRGLGWRGVILQQARRGDRSASSDGSRRRNGQAAGAVSRTNRWG